jgi:hypothetical protein
MPDRARPCTFFRPQAGRHLNLVVRRDPAAGPKFSSTARAVPWHPLAAITILLARSPSARSARKWKKQ